jgi:hypothetical protein
MTEHTRHTHRKTERERECVCVCVYTSFNTAISTTCSWSFVSATLPLQRTNTDKRGGRDSKAVKKRIQSKLVQRVSPP